MKICYQNIVSLRFRIAVFLITVCFIQNTWAQSEEPSLEPSTTIKNHYKIIPLPLPNNDLDVKFEPSEPLLDLEKIEVDVKPQEELSEEEVVIERFLRAYGRLGGGNFSRIYGEGFFEQQFNPRMHYGVHLRHLSAQSGPVGKDDYSAGSESFGKGFFYYGFNKSAIKAEFSYIREVSRFYGYDFDENADFIKSDSLQRKFDRFRVQVRHHNLTSDTSQSKLFYDYGLDLRRLTNELQGEEIQMGVTAKAHYDISEKIRVQAEAQAWLTNYQDLGKTQTRNYFQIQPMAIYRSEKIDAGLGVNFVQDDDTLSNSDNTYIFPSVFARYRMSRYFHFEVGYRGGVERASWWNFTAENPWLSVNTNLANTVKNWELYGKLAGSFYPTWTYEVGASLGSYKNMYFYFNTPGDSAKFTIQYAPLNTTVFTIQGETQLTITKKLQAIAQAKIIAYDVKSFERAYHRPNVEGNGILIYTPNEKLRLETHLWLALGLEALNTTTGRDERLSDIFDLSLEAEYKVWKEMSAFVSLNNILSVEYKRYLHYPHMGFNVLIGLAYGIR